MGTQFLEGPVFADGSHGQSRAEVELGVIRAAELGSTGTLVAQFLWATRDYIRKHGGLDRPLETMSIEEIVEFARGVGS